MSAPYYITTAIAYPNGRPHIGHAYEAVTTDAIARFQRLMGRDVCFVTGTDEHGLKMDQTARAAGRATIDLADEMSSYFRDMYAKLNISNDHFCRTTAPSHHAACQELWNRLAANDDLYLDVYEGWYSVRDEAFYDESELIEGEDGSKLSPQGTPVEWTSEETWFFRLSKYEKPLLELYAAQPDLIRPDSRRNETIRFVEGGLRDLSVSRTSFDWGVKVPGSPNHVMYVWLDALATYISGIGFPNETTEWQKFWPANVHIIGKDIVRFHAVYWPAFLMSAKLPLPQQIFGHGFLLARGGEKMSKSLGNVVDPIVLADRFGVDQLRYFFLREVSFGQDGSYSPEAIVTRCNAELANSFGNLAQRTLSQIYKNMDGRLIIHEMSPSEIEFLSKIATLLESNFVDSFNNLQLSVAVDYWVQAVSACNQYIDEQAPWTLKKTDPDKMQAVLMTLFRAIRELAIYIQPIVPEAAGNLLNQMGVPTNERDNRALLDVEWLHRAIHERNFVLPAPIGIFPRLEMPVEESA